MAEQKQQKRRKPRQTNRRNYVPRSNAVHITVYSQDGSPVPQTVLDQAAEAVTQIALDNRLLIGLATT